MKKFYSKVSSIALLLCLTTQTVFSMEEDPSRARAAVIAFSHASPSSLKFSNIEAMRVWMSKTEEFIQKIKKRSSALCMLEEDLTLPLVITIGPMIVPFMNIDVFKTWEDQISGILNPKDLPGFPMSRDQFLENIRADAAYKGPPIPSLVVGTVYNFLCYFCGFRHDLCLKIAELSSKDEDKIKYHQEAQRSLSYYFCHNFMPHVAPDNSLKRKLRENFCALTQKFVNNSRRLEVLSSNSAAKIKRAKEGILNLNREIELLDSTTGLNASVSEAEEMRALKQNAMETLVLRWTSLYCYTGDLNYLNFARTTLDRLPADSQDFDFLQDMVKRSSEDPQQQKDPVLMFEKYHFSEDSKFSLSVLSGWYQIKKSLKQEIFPLAVSRIKNLERLIHESFEAQTVSKGQDDGRELSHGSLEKVYREYYVQMQRSEFLYPTIVDYILSFMIVGDIQGALDRFNAAGDLKFGDGQTIRTHQPYLKAILENLRGNPEELLDISRRAVGELSHLNKPEKAEQVPEESARKETSEKLKGGLSSCHLFLIRHENSLSYLPYLRKADRTLSEKSPALMMDQLEKKRRSRVSSGLIQSLNLLLGKLERKSDVAPYREPEPKKPVLSLTITPENPPLAPHAKVSAAQPQKSAAQEREEKHARHLKREEEREKRKLMDIAGPAEAAADVPAPVKSQSASPFENDTRTISELYTLKGVALKVEKEIEGKTWAFKHSEFVKYLEQLGCTQRPNNGTSHLHVEMPDMVVYEKNGHPITILSKDLNIQGGTLTFKNWEKSVPTVPFLMRNQILAAREKLRQLEIAKQKKALDDKA